MFKSTFAALITLLILSSTAFAGKPKPPKCNPGTVAGSYTSADPNPDVFGNGTNIAHTWLFQLNLQEDGTVFQYWTGFNDYFVETGTASPYVGSWKCLPDGKLVVTVIRALYTPIPLGSPACSVGPVCVPTPDLELFRHLRSTYLFSVEDENTLKRVKAVARRYGVTEDPSDPTGGILGPIVTNEVVYKRLKASDADLP
jgi:hypothetical protein